MCPATGADTGGDRGRRADSRAILIDGHTARGRPGAVIRGGRDRIAGRRNLGRRAHRRGPEDIASAAERRLRVLAHVNAVVDPGCVIVEVRA